MGTDEKYIKACLNLAKRSGNRTSPNPLVGCVVVKDGRIISKGYHKKFGDLHAEREALAKLNYQAEGATLYVNLEPCCHWGKTPPCTEAIIESGIRRVIIGMTDPNPKVRGKGIETLKEAGIEVRVGVLEKECKYLNRGFIKWIQSGIPYVIIKWAQTVDGKIATINGESKWISSESSLRYAHSLRAFCDAVIIGKNTLYKDDPQLTVRFVKGHNPKRVILCNKIEIKRDFNVITYEPNNTWFFGTSIDKESKELLIKKGVRFTILKEREGNLDLKEVLSILGQEGITKVLVEGGRRIIGHFIKEELFDEISTVIAPKVMGSGISAVETTIASKMDEVKKLYLYSVRRLGEDVLLVLINPQSLSFLS
ncbi:MAG: bifunctional diaminohydroxyphosphoribosylaminopyrimidine deaminase/5-amino-6-(5-phosphoribosylamino)uracil reductase RibD [Thermosulfidibacteraceae bacterium]